MGKPWRFALLASGTGSNVAAILAACRAGQLPTAEPRVVLSNVAQAPVLAQARAYGIPSATIAHGDYTSREAFEEALSRAIHEHGAEWVVLAGFMRILSNYFLSIFPDRIINIHPSLLPAFPGLHAQRQALAQGAKVSGCTVHFVDGSVDGGPIIAQATVPVLAGDDETSLSARILDEEHRLYPQVIGWLADGRVIRQGKQVSIIQS